MGLDTSYSNISEILSLKGTSNIGNIDNKTNKTQTKTRQDVLDTTIQVNKHK